MRRAHIGFNCYVRKFRKSFSLIAKRRVCILSGTPLRKDELNVRMKEILVVDDDSMYIELVKEVSSSMNVSVVAARNGKDALSVLQTTSVDMIVSDVSMPVMDGRTFHVQVLKNEQWAKIPFVFMTGMADDVIRGYVAKTPGVRLIRKENLVDELTDLLSTLR